MWLRGLLVWLTIGNSRARPTALVPRDNFVDTSLSLTCPECGRLGDDDPNCCSPGGSWHGMCEGGNNGGQHTFHDGYQACNGGELAASALPEMPFSCPETKADKRVDCGDHGSEQACLAYGCCFNALPPGEVGPHCYLPTVPGPTYEEEHNVMFYLYFVLSPAVNHGRHTGTEYVAHLAAGCARLTKAGKTFALLGDVEWILSVAPPCKLASKKASKQISFDTLPLPRSIADFTARIGGGCASKGWKPGTLPLNQFRTLSTIWHSKIGVLCEAARQRPNELSVLLDGGLMFDPTPEGGKITAAEEALRRNLSRAEEATELRPEETIRGRQRAYHLSDKMALGWVETDQREKEREYGKLQAECYGVDNDCAPNGYTFKFPGCVAEARIAAGVLALRGADCGAIEGAYVEAMTEFDASACSCYDEEVVLTRLLDDPRWKNLMKPHT